MGAVAEFERALIHERQREGIALVRRRGVYKGGKRRLDDAGVGELKALLGMGVHKSAAARGLGISRRSIDRHLTPERSAGAGTWGWRRPLLEEVPENLPEPVDRVRTVGRKI
jgi:DNA invertase Pin-like site-specific DNA recombinase